MNCCIEMSGGRGRRREGKALLAEQTARVSSIELRKKMVPFA